MIFLGGLLYKRSKWAIFSSLAIIIVSLYDWLSLPGEAKFGLPARFEDFSPLLFCGSTFRSGGWNPGPGMDPSSGKIKLCVEDYSSRLEGRITGDKGKLSGGCYFRHIGFLVRTWRTRLRKPLSLNGVMFGQIGRRPLRVPCFATAGTSKRILRSITPKSSP